jgi:hypothetical protein
MNIPKYWAKASTEVTPKWNTQYWKSFPLSVWGWSNESDAEAQKKARKMLERAVRWMETSRVMHRDHYYEDRPPREEILREITNENDEPVAIITRNSYGSQILNTTALAFIDVDLPPHRKYFWPVSAIRKWAGKSIASPRETAYKKAQATAASLGGDYTIRMYHTAAGLRFVIVNKYIDPKSAEMERLFDLFETDKLYRKLCINQECYRARLTPKRWRCGILDAPPHRFPWENAADENRYRDWEKAYEAKIESYATCKWVMHWGSPHGDEVQEKLLKLHDQITKAMTDLPLS